MPFKFVCFMDIRFPLCLRFYRQDQVSRYERISNGLIDTRPHLGYHWSRREPAGGRDRRATCEEIGMSMGDAGLHPAVRQFLATLPPDATLRRYAAVVDALNARLAQLRHAESDAVAWLAEIDLALRATDPEGRQPLLDQRARRTGERADDSLCIGRLQSLQPRAAVAARQQAGYTARSSSPRRRPFTPSTSHAS